LRRSNALPRQHAAVQQPAMQSSDGDVYAAGSSVLDAAYGSAGGAEAEPYVLSIEVQDIPGVLNQVGGLGGCAPEGCVGLTMRALGGLGALGAGQGRAGLLVLLHGCWHTRMPAGSPDPTCLCRSPACLQVTGVVARRSYNVQSLAVGNSEREGMSRITMVVPGSSNGSVNLIKQLNKLVHVEKVSGHTGWDRALVQTGKGMLHALGLGMLQITTHLQPQPLDANNLAALAPLLLPRVCCGRLRS
jgi:acetolactate synthase regulatory subunit